MACGVVSELICAVEFIFLLWVLYQLLAAVNKTRFCIATSTLSAGSLALAFFFGLLVFKLGFLPRILGVLLIAACFGYFGE
jgi:hypothetical protein